ncbi:MAG TPA: hypothetical protein DCE78_00435 [Bacteroidetes bacterium]|nr:hypothetical protein [Bacteroidota bacterium]
MEHMIVWTGFVFGLFGSIHCAGMCGPIALALPGVDSSRSMWITGRVLYNLGRVVTYALMGLILGLFGIGFSLIGLQEWVSIFAGVILLVYVLLPASITSKVIHAKPVNWPDFLKTPFKKLFKNGSLISLFFIGLLNGLLPCGFVYLALVGAIGMGNPVESSLFMALFGLGTLPVMLFVSLMTGFLNSDRRQKLSKIFPYITAAVAIILILRGLSLGIPMISPDLSGNVNSGHGLMGH